MPRLYYALFHFCIWALLWQPLHLTTNALIVLVYPVPRTRTLACRSLLSVYQLYDIQVWRRFPTTFEVVPLEEHHVSHHTYQPLQLVGRTIASQVRHGAEHSELQ